MYMEHKQRLQLLNLGTGRMDFNERKGEEFIFLSCVYSMGLEIGGLAGYWRAWSVVCIFEPSFSLSFAVVFSGFVFV